MELSREVRGGRAYWERTIHTPEGDLHDVKQSLVLRQGSGDGPEVVEPLAKDLERDLPLMRYMMADPSKMDLDSARVADERIGDRGLAVPSLMSPIDCRDMMRPTDFLMLYYDDRGAFREMVQIGAEAMTAETRRVLDAGFPVVQTWWFYASPSAGRKSADLRGSVPAALGEACGTRASVRRTLCLLRRRATAAIP